MERPRIGVFLCGCGSAPGKHLGLSQLEAYLRTLPYVERVESSQKICDESSLASIAESMSTHELNRAVVGSCASRTHASLFRSTCIDAGIDPNSSELVNLLDQCAAVHQAEPEAAREKAKDLLRMAVFKAALLEPLQERSQAVEPSAMVIGSGIAGLTAATSLGNRGFHVILVEREPELGGLLRHRYRIYPTNDSGPSLIRGKVKIVQDHPKIDVLSNAQVRSVRGSVGNYEVVVQQEEIEHEFKVGALVIATGAQEFAPTGQYGYDGKRVVTQGELDGMLAEGLGNAEKPVGSVVMIQCVGSRDETRPYCSRTCCMTAVKNSLVLRERDSKPQVYVLYRDILSLGTTYEELYRQARGQGVTFIRYLPESPPVVENGRVRVFDDLLGETVSIPSDLVVLSTPLVPQPDTADLAQMLKVSLHDSGFYQEAHGKHRPLDCTNRGIFLCGAAYFPMDIGETVSQAYGAAGRASILLGRDEVQSDPAVARVDERACTACGLCEATCLYQAVEVVIVDERRGTRAARVNEFLCRGCGACVAGCRSRAIDLAASTNRQVHAMIEAF